MDPLSVQTSFRRGLEGTVPGAHIPIPKPLSGTWCRSLGVAEHLGAAQI